MSLLNPLIRVGFWKHASLNVHYEKVSWLNPWIILSTKSMSLLNPWLRIGFESMQAWKTLLNIVAFVNILINTCLKAYFCEPIGILEMQWWNSVHRSFTQNKTEKPAEIYFLIDRSFPEVDIYIICLLLCN